MKRDSGCPPPITRPRHSHSTGGDDLRHQGFHPSPCTGSPRRRGGSTSPSKRRIVGEIPNEIVASGPVQRVRTRSPSLAMNAPERSRHQQLWLMAPSSAGNASSCTTPIEVGTSPVRERSRDSPTPPHGEIDSLEITLHGQLYNAFSLEPNVRSVSDLHSPFHLRSGSANLSLRGCLNLRHLGTLERRVAALGVLHELGPVEVGIQGNGHYVKQAKGFFDVIACLSGLAWEAMRMSQGVER